MKKIITVALLCAPLALHAAYFTQETVSFDDDGKPLIQAQLMLPPITASVDVPYSPFSLFDDDDPFAKPTLIDPSIEQPTPEMIAQEKIAQATKEQVAAEKVAIAAKKKLEDEKAKFIVLKRAQEKLKIAKAKKDAEIAAEKIRNASIYTIAKGQRYSTVLRTWLEPLILTANNTKGVKYRGVTWLLSPETLSKLNEKGTDNMVFNRDLTLAIQELGEQLDMSLVLTLDEKRRVGALSESNVGVYWIHGSTLKAAIENLTNDFEWQWLAESNLHSWLAPNDYPFASAYPLAVKDGAFEEALNTMLQGYPLQAKLLYATRTVFITAK